MNRTTEHLSVTTFLPSVQALTALWCHTHRGLLLEHEIELDHGLGKSEADWGRVRAAALEGRVADIPIAREMLGAWKCQGILCDAGLEHCGDLLPIALVAVENVWGECLHDEVLENALRAAFDVAAARREQILADYHPPAIDVPSPWHEVHQGCARADTTSRVRVIRAIDRALCRSADRWADACVDLDHAAEFEAKGEYKSARESLDAAVRASWPLKRIDRREPAGVALAEHLWRCGEVDLAKQLLSQLRGDSARELSRRFADKVPEREVLVGAEQVHRERNGVESWSALTYAHLSAGHGIAAERIARELCTEHPDDARSWETKARVLHANARYRSVPDSADKWIDLAPDSASARSLLARAFARVGYVGREPAGSIAAAAIELCEFGQVLPLDELEELAEICYRAEFVDWARRADDLVCARRAEREPDCAWLVAATLRRCHGPWADDAPEWIARLADSGPHVLAGWGADRVDSVQHWCVLIDRRTQAPFGWRRVETDLTPAARAIALEATNCSLCAQARDLALRAARDLGHSEQGAMSTIGAPCANSEPEVTALPESASGSADQWSQHRAAIEAAFGPRIAIALRASEVAQQAWTAVRNDRPNGASLLVREVLQDEKLAWARWARNQPVLETATTGDPAYRRLVLLRELAQFTDEEIRRTEWSTRWDDLDRW